MSDQQYPALSKQDASRLPCGALEKWVFSTDRTKLLSPQSNETDTKTDDDSKSQPTKTLFVADSEESYYYTMLHIDNEIQKLSNQSEYDKDELNKVQTSFNNYVDKVKQKWDESKQYVHIPSKIKDLIFRNNCRQLNSDDIKTQSAALEAIEKRISTTYEYNKPSNPDQGVYSAESQSRNHEAYITDKDLQNKLDKQMRDSLTGAGYYSKNISSNYKTNALPYLIRQEKLSLEQKQNIIENYYNKLFILGNDGMIMDWLLEDLTNNKNGENKYPRFNFRSIHSQLTLKQLDELKNKKNDLLKVSSFIEGYLKKLMPLELGIYIGKNWEKDIPLNMKWKFIKKLYEYANGDDLQKADYNSSNSIRSYIYYQYMMFIEQNYYLLNKQREKGMVIESNVHSTAGGDDIIAKDDGDEVKQNKDEKTDAGEIKEGDECVFDSAYDIEAIIKYICIPKRVSYNEEFRNKWYKQHDKKQWGGDTVMSYNYQYAFLSQFRGIPQFSDRKDNAYFQRFFEFIFTDNGKKYWNKFIKNKDNIKDEKVQKCLENATGDIDSVMKVFGQYIDGRFMEKMRLRCIINNAMELDKLDENIKKLKELEGDYYVNNLKDDVLIEFDEYKNAKRYNLGDEIKIFVNVKNVNDLTIKFFEINTKSYYRDKEQQIETDMNLDGLNARLEQVKKSEEMNIKNSYHKKQISINFPSELSSKRGVYFVDILSNGRHARSVIKIGEIKFLTRVTGAGHLFQLLDEENKIINGSIFMSGHLYKTDEKTQEILIPFTTRPNSSQKIILEREDDATFNILTNFKHESESYSLECGIYIDREQLLEKKRATIVVRGGLFLNNNRVDISLLENIKLSVKLKTGDGVDVDKTFNNFTLYDDKESTATFTVPNEPRAIAIRLDCEVKNMSQNSKESLEKIQTFNMNSIDNSSNIGQMFLIPNVNGSYIVGLYGKNGEGIANKDVEIILDSKYYKSTITFSLTSDKFGRIYLPERLNDNYIRLRVYCRSVNGIRCDWDLNNGINLCDTPNVLNMTTNSSVCIPYTPKIKDIKDNDHFGLFDKYYINSYNNFQYDATNGYICISNLPAGNFILKCLDLDYDINIYVTECGQLIDSKRYNVNKNEIVELSSIKPLQISKIEETIVENDEKEQENILKIQLNGTNDRTRVHLLATHMISRFSISQFLNCIKPSSLSKKFMTQSTNKYLPQRMIGEELRYILEREKAKKYIGNSLIRPSFLIKPLQHKETSNKTQTAKKGGDIQKESLHDEAWEDQSARRRESGGVISSQSPNDDKYNIEFIGVTAQLIENQKPDNNGLVTVNISKLNINQKFLRIIAFDEENCVLRGLALRNDALDGDINEYKCPQFEYTDNTLRPGLNPRYQYVDERNIILLNEKDQEYKLDDVKTSQFETYQSFKGIFNLIQTISNNHELKTKWSFLTRWNNMNDKEKLKKYDEFFCHELHLFLKKKDNKFFQEKCIPLIRSKLNKDFMDYYLLNNTKELSKYCKFDKLQTLNPLEQILLAQLFSKTKPELSSSLLKYYKSKQDSIDIDPKQFDRLFRTALATKAMDDAQTIQDSIQKKMKEEKVWEEEEEEEDDDDSDDSDDAEQECAMIMDESLNMSMNMGMAGYGGMQQQQQQRHMMRSMAAPNMMNFMAMPKSASKSMRSESTEKKRFGGHSKQRAQMQQQQLFKQVEQTKEYQETYYYKILFERDTKTLIPLNKFWASYGIHMLEPKGCDCAFLSEYFLFATSSLNEILCVLAVMDVEFNQDNKTVEFKYGEKNDRSVRLIAQTPTILFAKELKKQIDDNDNDNDDDEKQSDDIDSKKDKQAVAIHVVYFDPNDKYGTDENGERMDKFVNKYDMRCGKIYACLSILTNVSSIRQSIEILCQIPTGSIPVNKGFRTKTNFITLGAYSVHKFQFYFYFPSNGKFRQYPIVVTKKNKIIGSSKKTDGDKCKIIVKNPDKDKKLDTKSWNDVSLNGSNDDILNYIKTHNLNKFEQLDITRIYYKLNKDVGFYDDLIDLLRGEGYYDANVWAIQLYYFKKAINDSNIDEIKKRFGIVQEYLSMNSTFKSYISPYFQSSEFEYDDLYNNKYNYLEYIPLVNARAHLLGQKREILNDSFKQQYEKCLRRCTYRSTSVFDLQYNDAISLLYYLLLQDRIEESLDVYKIIQNNKELYNEIETKAEICFDYFKAYMALFVDDNDNEKGIENAINVAQIIKKKYENNNSLISSKKKLFEDIQTLLDDLDEYKREDDDDMKLIVDGHGDRDRKMKKLADNTPSLDFEINKSERKLIITSANINRVSVNFYTMNTEILFSNSPFFKDENKNNNSNKSAFAYIAPNNSITQDITKEKKKQDDNQSQKTEIAIPDELKNTNLFIQVISSTVNISKPFYDHELSVLVQEQYGQLKVLVPSGKNKNKLVPLKKAYVKVYSQTNYGQNEFYKDGYTDIRGKFDYASISTDQLNKTKKFGIFIKAVKHGSIIKEAKPPKR